jgi:hypothetical protein
VTDDSSFFAPVFVRNEKYSLGVNLIRMFEKVELFEFFMVETKLLDELRITKNQKWSVSDVG